MALRPGHHARRHPRSKAWWLLVPAAALVAVVGLFAWDAWHIMRDAEELETRARAAKQAVDERDLDTLKVEAAALEVAARDFASHIDGPHWDLAAKLPIASDQVPQLQAAASAMVVLADDVLAPLGQDGALEGLTLPTVQDGRLDPLALEPYRDGLVRASDALREQQEALAAVDTSRSIDKVADAVDTLSEQITTLRPTVDAAAITAQLLPAMAGGEGPRHYLVMVQNNAEPRALGGIPGAVIELTVDDGRFEMGEYFSAGELNAAIDEPLSLRPDELDLFTERLAIYSQNATFTPEYPRAAQLIDEFATAITGTDYDGVLSIDPVAMGYLLDGQTLDPVDGIDVEKQGLAPVMLNGAYFAHAEPRDQDAFFELAASSLFTKVLDSGAGAIGPLERAIEEGRFMVWSSHQEEQKLLADTLIGGDFLVRDDAAGVFVNDGSRSKIGYYVDVDVEGETPACGAVPTGSISVTVSHTFDGDAFGLPQYIGGRPGLDDVGRFKANVLVYPPRGFVVDSVSADGVPQNLRAVQHGDRQATATWIELDPGQSTTLEYSISRVSQGAQWAVIAVTPGPYSNDSQWGLVFTKHAC